MLKLNLTEYMYPFSIKLPPSVHLSRALFLFYLDNRNRHANTALLASRRLASHRWMRENTKHEPGVSISFVNQENPAYPYPMVVASISDPMGGTDATGIFLSSSFFPLANSGSLIRREKATTKVPPFSGGIHPRIKRAAISATFIFFVPFFFPPS